MYTESITINDFEIVRVFNGCDLVETYKQYECGCIEFGTVISDRAIEWGRTERRCQSHGWNSNAKSK